MNNTNQIPYGALYSFQPDYLDYVVHERIYHQEHDQLELSAENPLGNFCHWVKTLFH